MLAQICTCTVLFFSRNCSTMVLERTILKVSCNGFLKEIQTRKFNAGNQSSKTVLPKCYWNHNIIKKYKSVKNTNIATKHMTIVIKHNTCPLADEHSQYLVTNNIRLFFNNTVLVQLLLSKAATKDDRSNYLTRHLLYCYETDERFDLRSHIL